MIMYLNFLYASLDGGGAVPECGTTAGTAPEPKELGYAVRLPTLTGSAR